MSQKLRSILLSAIAASFWALAVLYSQNTVFHNPWWQPFNSVFYPLRMDAVEVLMTRQVLAGFRLNPGHYGQHRRIISRQNYAPEKIAFLARFSHGGTVSVLVTDEKGTSEGLRISANPIVESQWYKLDIHEKFLEKSKLSDLPPLEMDVLIEIEKTPVGIKLMRNGRKLGIIQRPFPAGRITVEVVKAQVANVRITEKGEETELSFWSGQGFWKLFLPVFFAIVLLSFLSPLRLPVIFCVTSLLWLSFDYLHYSKTYFHFNAQEFELQRLPQSKATDLERFRFQIFKTWFEVSGGEKTDRTDVYEKYGQFQTYFGLLYCRSGSCTQSGPTEAIPDFPPKGKKTKRILIIGGSVSGGWGATTPEKNYPARLAEFLKEGPLSRSDVEVICHSRGLPFISKLELLRFRKLISNYKPDLLVLEFFFEYTDPKVVREFLKEVTDSGLRTAYFRPPYNVPEMNFHFWKKSVEYFKKPRPDDGAVEIPFLKGDPIRPLLKTFPIEFADSNRVFLDLENYQGANLFWDHHHLTDTGHELLARYLTGVLAPIL